MLCGIAAEFLVHNLLTCDHQTQPLVFFTSQLLEVARGTAIGRQRLKAAQPHLTREFGIPYRTQGGIHYHLSWEALPASVLLDQVFALDVAFCHKGWQFGLDLTTNPHQVPHKQAKLRQLQPLWSALEFDCVGVMLLQQEPFPQQLFNTLRTLIRTHELVPVLQLA